MKYITGILLLLIQASVSIGQTKVIELNRDWKFKDADSSRWLKATVPGTIHTDLLHNKRIPDPFYRDNETRVQWVSKRDWDYTTTFQYSLNKMGLLSHLTLVFEGLDTYADVYLNNNLILQADNMFRTWKVPVKELLKPGKNTLLVRFHSADRIVDSLANAALPLVRPCENNRHYARKAQYHFGWDWAPKLTTCGIWRSVSIVTDDDQPKEDLTWEKAIPAIELVRRPDSAGRSFYFGINNQRVFMKGANWIPADVFLPRVTKAKYRQLLVAAKEANFNMLRVWGGGVYEDDAFYDLCDSLGIMVWQDFMFAGAMYPGDAHFMENVKQEAIDNIKRLRHHRCIVLWCGNNEMDEAWHNWGWQEQFHLSPKDSAQLWDDYTKLFEELLPQLVKEYDGMRPYVSTSPTHGWGRKESMTDGDSHYWGVWWGMEPIGKYKEKVPRFMSEYGMQAMPAWQSIQQYSMPQDWDTSSAVMKTHQKHPTGYKTLATYLQQNNIPTKDFKTFVAATQEVQSRALSTAITAHMNAAPYCMGTLFWQFNDCWPVSSWSVVDYYGRKKKAYYTVKQLYGQRINTARSSKFLPLRH